MYLSTVLWGKGSVSIKGLAYPAISSILPSDLCLSPADNLLALSRCNRGDIGERLQESSNKTAIQLHPKKICKYMGPS